MACTDNNPCDPCSQHDDCGCVNPNTFGCTTYSGTALTCLGVLNAEDGDSILKKINDKVCEIGKVLTNGNDICPKYLIDKLEAGLNITLTEVGTGCDMKVRIDSVIGGVPIDINAKVSAADTTTGYLNDKIKTGLYLSKVIQNPGANEDIKLDVVPITLVSTDLNNPIHIGTDGGLMSDCFAPDGSETKIIPGTGIDVVGQGTVLNPYVISTNPSIQVVRACFDSVWRNVTMVATGNGNVVYAVGTGTPQYRYRFDGTIEFRGSATLEVAFGSNISANRQYIITMGNIPTTCLTLVEQSGTFNLKSITTIESAGQMYNYTIQKSTQNIRLIFQSSFTAATTNRTIVVDFVGAVSHPNI